MQYNAILLYNLFSTWTTRSHLFQQHMDYQTYKQISDYYNTLHQQHKEYSDYRLNYKKYERRHHYKNCEDHAQINEKEGGGGFGPRGPNRPPPQGDPEIHMQMEQWWNGHPEASPEEPIQNIDQMIEKPAVALAIWSNGRPEVPEAALQKFTVDDEFYQGLHCATTSRRWIQPTPPQTCAEAVPQR